MADQSPDRIPRRTAEIELWDTNPVGTQDAWHRELLQFWSFVFTRGRRVKSGSALGKIDPTTGKGRPRNVDEVAATLADRIVRADGGFVAHNLEGEIRRWLADTIVVPGERRRQRGPLPAAGLTTPNYAALLLFNRGVTRERFWAAFLWNALASDFAAAELLPEEDLVSRRLDTYLALGLKAVDSNTSRRVWKGFDFPAIASADPETYLVLRALGTSNGDDVGDASNGLGEEYLRGSTPAAAMNQFLCPGAVILMRRSLRLFLGQQETIGHPALSGHIETALTFHASQYFLRGMRVLNDLSEGRTLPPDCSACWARFQPDLRPSPTYADRERWQSVGYTAQADADQADWVESNCQAEDLIFVNAGRKEDQAAKDLARLSLERLRRDLASYTVNRIVLAIARGIAGRLAPQFGEEAISLDKTYERLDQWAGEPTSRAVLAYAWRDRITQLGNDPDLGGSVVDRIPNRVQAAGNDPGKLEAIVRELVSEAVLSSRAFSRYIELLNSLLGGGALPTNQDAKGLMARGGSQTVKFHLSLNDRALEFVVALSALEARDESRMASDADRRHATSLQGFLEFLERRFHIVLAGAPSGAWTPPGLVAEAAAESISALRARLSSMGLLEEYSDSLEWSRLTWGMARE